MIQPPLSDPAGGKGNGKMRQGGFVSECVGQT